MSKIFEALQRAQQQAGVAPGDPAVTPQAPPSSVIPPQPPADPYNPMGTGYPQSGMDQFWASQPAPPPISPLPMPGLNMPGSNMSGSNMSGSNMLGSMPAAMGGGLLFDNSVPPSPSIAMGAPVGGAPIAALPLGLGDAPMMTPDSAQPALWEVPALVRFSPRSKVVVAQNPTSLAAEQYRVLRTNIIKLSQTQALKVILVTSPGPGDGKTLTAMNLALSFCQKPETRVLLIEADLRKPSIGALVAMDPGAGLAEYLGGGATLEQVVRPTSIPNFHLLDSGHRAAQPADLLHSPRLANMMEVLRAHFNWIVLDGPPTNPVADYELLTPISDGVILVVRPHYTQRDLLRLTTEALRGRKVLGAVINGSQHFERYGSAYGYGYGYTDSNTAEPDGKKKKKKRKGYYGY